VFAHAPSDFLLGLATQFLDIAANLDRRHATVP
jgi:hypothetical protein